MYSWLQDAVTPLIYVFLVTGIDAVTSLLYVFLVTGIDAVTPLLYVFLVIGCSNTPDICIPLSIKI
jgi:hypothetical protein